MCKNGYRQVFLCTIRFCMSGQTCVESLLPGALREALYCIPSFNRDVRRLLFASRLLGFTSQIDHLGCSLNRKRGGLNGTTPF